MSGPVTFPVFTSGTSTGLAQLTQTGSNFRLPFTTAGLWAKATQQSGGGLFGGTFTFTNGSHQLVPILIGRRRYVTVFP
jgi:hypothetical protein